MRNKFFTSTCIAALAMLSTALPSAAAGDTVVNAREATAAFNDPAVALAAGYDLLTDSAGLACCARGGRRLQP